MIISDQQNVVIHFLMTRVFQQQFLYSLTWSSKQFLILNIFCFLFLKKFLHVRLIFLCFDPWIFYYLLANIFQNFWLFLVSFACYECWLPSISRACATSLANNNLWNIFNGNIFGWVQGISQISVKLSFLIFNLKALAKNFCSPSRRLEQKEKR